MLNPNNIPTGYYPTLLFKYKIPFHTWSYKIPYVVLPHRPYTHDSLSCNQLHSRLDLHCYMVIKDLLVTAGSLKPQY